MSERERDLAQAIYAALTSEATIDAALDVWGEVAELPDRDLLALVIRIVAAAVIGDLLTLREREAARTGPWDDATEEEWRGRLATQCGQTLAARYERDVAVRKLAEVVAAREGGHHLQEEDGYPGSLVPP